ncbi:MAG: exodeoxyribonuclease VII large subunit [Ignavibacteria bacterium]|jgi:exodeoxyribonuclease VII large subunit|nr:exodeoxyribonuclease VII large subunit [Ignavibacteria bacterium]
MGKNNNDIVYEDLFSTPKSQSVEEKTIFSVTEINNTIKLLLEANIGIVSVEGEVSNYKPHYSGHRYFTLKDKASQISCTMWKSRNLNFELSDGMKVIATGIISVYPPRGTYQIDVISLRPAGLGSLYQAFEKLKAKLSELGYFDAERKKAIPEKIYNIGISTSPTGAVVKDIFTTIQRRYPLATIYFRPTIVQGEQAAPDIVDAISELQETPAEVIIIGRGGGSIEDLWAYNTEEVANAILSCKIPIISAVGHETDFSIADFVADLRAATPTAAAELATPIELKFLQETILTLCDNMQEIMFEKIQYYHEIIDGISSEKIVKRIMDKIYNHHQLLDNTEILLNKNIVNYLEIKKQIFEKLAGQCKTLAPLSPIDRGFALLKSNDRIIKKNEKLVDFDTVEIIRKLDKTFAKIQK